MFSCPVLFLDWLNVPEGTSILEIAESIRAHEMVGVPVTPAIMENKKEALEATKAIRDMGLKWNMLPWPVDFYQHYVEQDEFDKGIDTLKRWAELGQQMGVKYAFNHVMPSSPKPFDESFDWCVRRIYRVNQVMENNDINYGLEYVGEYDARHAYDNEFVYTLPGIMALGDAAGNGVGFIYDTYHTHCGGRENDDFHLALHNIDRISGVHFSDGMPGKTLEKQKDLTRSYPETTGVVPSASHVSRLLEAGYAGPVLIEPYNPDYFKHLKQISFDQAMAEYSAGFKYAFRREEMADENKAKFLALIRDHFLSANE